MMTRVEIAALIANLRDKSHARAEHALAQYALHKPGCRRRAFDSPSVECGCGLARALTASRQVDPLYELAADLIQDLIERLCTLEDQRG